MSLNTNKYYVRGYIHNVSTCTCGENCQSVRVDDGYDVGGLCVKMNNRTDFTSRFLTRRSQSISVPAKTAVCQWPCKWNVRVAVLHGPIWSWPRFRSGPRWQIWIKHRACDHNPPTTACMYTCWEVCQLLTEGGRFLLSTPVSFASKIWPPWYDLRCWKWR